MHVQDADRDTSPNALLGRVKAGTCYRLYSRKRFESFAERDVPEIQSTPLQSLCLQIKLLNVEFPSLSFIR
jgi:HrpA-like RNA helicase